MFKNKFTRGSWRATPGGRVIVADDGGGFSVIASTPRGVPVIERTANGLLLAASPDLLAACESALALIRDPDAEAPDADRVEKILEAAIRKASGE